VARLRSWRFGPIGDRSVRKQKQERFKELCEHAEVVDDPEKLAKIALQIGRILESEVDELKKHAKYDRP
jgi:uncharacterized protein with von Willebrand factor type A (vWA) domain